MLQPGLPSFFFPSPAFHLTYITLSVNSCFSTITTSYPPMNLMLLALLESSATADTFIAAPAIYISPLTQYPTGIQHPNYMFPPSPLHCQTR